MDAVICTLFENHYHNGVAALVNSLYKQGFRGNIFAGYKGKLPNWATNTSKSNVIEWPGSSTLNVGSELSIHFLPLTTDYHLTNYKPDFMLELLSGPAVGAKGIFYFDPDIVVTAPWKFFLEWIGCGVAVCEDVNSTLAEYHPRRVAWRRYFEKSNIKLSYKSSIYVNGGFTGVSKADTGFLETWKTVQDNMALLIGGLNRSAFKSGGQLAEELQGDFAPFGKTDQDALNAAVEAWDGHISFMGQEAMAFKLGLSIMPHALGSPKPWNWKIMQQAFKGRSPRLVDRKYWDSVGSPIPLFSKSTISIKKMQINAAAFIGRFYKK